MAMVAATLGFGSYVTTAALNQYSLTQNAATLATILQNQASGKLVSLVYSSVNPNVSCPTYGGLREGALVLELYNYGTLAFTPTMAFINGTLYAGSGTVSSGQDAAFTFTTPACVHPSGQTVLLVDAYGIEVQIAT